jgi:hypothetical protein
VAENQQTTAPGIIGLVLPFAAVVSGFLGIRTDGRRGWLQAVGALVVAIAIFAMLAART